MKCPSCDVTLVMSDRQGIEIDYCPQCRGVWLDRGELDKLVERQAMMAARPAPSREAPPYQRPPGEHRSYEWDDDDHYRGGYRGRKRRGWLDDIFDFD